METEKPTSIDNWGPGLRRRDPSKPTPELDPEFLAAVERYAEEAAAGSADDRLRGQVAAQVPMIPLRRNPNWKPEPKGDLQTD